MLGVLLLMSGCSLLAPQSQAVLSRPPPELPLRAEIREVPYFAQTEHHCGPAALAMALGSGAQITAVDVSAEWTAIGQRFWKKAGVADRITLRLDGGTSAIADLLNRGGAGSFDLAFIDADKSGYDAYYEGCLKLLRSGGVVLIDNVLWSGAVADPKEQDADTNALRALNSKIKDDGRVEMVMLPIGDGLTMARKI